MTDLNLTDEQRKALAPLVSRLDAAAIAMSSAQGRLSASTGTEPEGQWKTKLQDLRDAKEGYNAAYRALWGALGGRF